jgi:hypothetical protein
VTYNQLVQIDDSIIQDKSLSAKSLKYRHGLNTSVRSAQRYIRSLGWRKIRTKYCQFVSEKNRIERLIFAELCIEFRETFIDSIFIDGASPMQCKSSLVSLSTWTN